MEISHSNVRFYYSCFKMSSVNYHVALVHKENKLFKCECCDYRFCQSVTGKSMLQQFMNEISRSNVKFVTIDCLEKVT